MSEIKERTFRVMRPFKYDGEELERGDIWSPIGGLWDEKLMKNTKYLVEITPELLEFQNESRNALNDSRRKSLKGDVYELYEKYGNKIAKRLEKAGLVKVEDVEKLKDEEILKIEDIEDHHLKVIREENLPEKDTALKSKAKKLSKRRKSIKGKSHELYETFGDPVAKVLEAAGYESVKEVNRAEDDVLLKISGIGQKRLDAIRAAA